MTLLIYILFVVGAGVTLRADVQRRRLTFQKRAGWHLLTALDVACLAATVGVAFGLIPLAAVNGSVPLYAPETWGILAAGLLALFLWNEGRRQLQFQRPAGIVFGEWLILGGAYRASRNRSVRRTGARAARCNGSCALRRRDIGGRSGDCGDRAAICEAL